MELGEKIKFKSYNKVREGLVLEERKDKVLIVLVGEQRNEGVKVLINKNLII